MHRKCITFGTDSKGNEYIEAKDLNIIQKNKQPSVSHCNRNEQEKQVRIYATHDSRLCPVEAIKLLLEKLPPNTTSLFYKSKTEWQKETYWFNEALPMGKTQLLD